jgi:hypothetical protein
VTERRLAERLRRPTPSPARLSEAQAFPAGLPAGVCRGAAGPPRPAATAWAAGHGGANAGAHRGYPAFCADAGRVRLYRRRGASHQPGPRRARLGRTATTAATGTRPSRRAAPPSVRSWRVNATAGDRLPWRRARYVTRTTTTADPGTDQAGLGLFRGLLPGRTASNPEGSGRHHRSSSYAAYGVCW